MVLEKTLGSTLDSKKINPIHSKGNQTCVFIRSTDANRSAGLRGILLRGPFWFEVPLLRLFTPLFPEAENPGKVLVGRVESE